MSLIEPVTRISRPRIGAGIVDLRDADLRRRGQDLEDRLLERQYDINVEKRRQRLRRRIPEPVR